MHKHSETHDGKKKAFKKIQNNKIKQSKVQNIIHKLTTINLQKRILYTQKYQSMLYVLCVMQNKKKMLSYY